MPLGMDFGNCETSCMGNHLNLNNTPTLALWSTRAGLGDAGLAALVKMHCEPDDLVDMICGPRGMFQ